jgi:hypothetical protein
MNVATLNLRRTIGAICVVACLALGTSHPGWSFALHQLGYYGSGERAATLGEAWQDIARRLSAVHARCDELGAFICVATERPTRSYAADLAEGYLALANDPPDADFTAIEAPQVETAELRRISGIPRQLVASWNDLYANLARTAALLEAFVNSNQRAQGAALADDVVWEMLQSQLAALYADELSRLTADQPALAAKAVASWQLAGLPAVAAGGAPYPDLLADPDLAAKTAHFSAAMRALADGRIVRIDFLIALQGAGAEAHAARFPRTDGSSAPEDGAEDSPRGGSLAVALLGSDELPAAAIDPASLRLGPGLARFGGDVKFVDVDQDGHLDLVVRFSSADSGFACKADVVTLIGRALDGRPFGGLVHAGPGRCD